MMYPDLSLEYTKPCRNWNMTSRAEQTYCEIHDHITLQTPHDGQYRLQKSEKVTIAVYFKNYLELEISPQQLAKYIPDVVHWWGKIQIKGDPEMIHSEWAQWNLNEKHRDALYARVC